MQTVKTISEWLLPCLILLFLLGAFCKKTDAYQAFLDGAKDSMTTIVNILPPVVGLMIAIAMLRGSGLLDFLCNLISPVTAFLGIPTETMPLALLRPISGSGGIAMLADILKTYGPDSLIGNVASVMAGSTETTFYTIAVYFGAVQVTDTRYAVKAALLADAAGILASVFVTRLFVGMS
jgi:nucleoside recognition